MKILIVEDQFIEAYDLQLILEKHGYTVTGIASSEEEALSLIAKDKPDLACLDIFIKGPQTGIDLAKKLQGSGIGFLYISANSGKEILRQAKVTNPYGFIVKPFREEDIVTTIEIASYRHKHSFESQQKHKSLLEQQFEKLFSSKRPWDETFAELGRLLQGFIPFDYLEISFNSQGSIQGLLRRNYSEYKIISSEELVAKSPSGKSILKSNAVYNSSEPEVVDKDRFIEVCNISGRTRLIAEVFGVRSLMAVPVIDDSSHLTLYFYSRQTECYDEQHTAMAEFLVEEFSHLNKLGHPLTDRFSKSPANTTDVSRKSYGDASGGLIGVDSKMLMVYDSAARVAVSDTSVLILGESGTGKEHVARCIHNLSARKDKAFIAINCAAIPQNLAESILFGHEKGAFTGANDRHIGKFEHAANGTIFLDEIGEMPIDLQVKLLRVLQENEIERVGGQKPIKINARIIAATNRNLEEEVGAGRFRIDLFYRLYVFPITVPPLRERRDDIVPLAEYFLESYCKKLKRKLISLSARAKAQLSNYQWPGNVRQLEHALQRAIILCDNDFIDVFSLPETQALSLGASIQEFSIDSIKSIHDMEREYISHILKKCKGKVYGTGGAAELLNLPPSTLNSKMKKLGISSRSIGPIEG